MDNTELQTERLILRTWTAGDFEAYACMTMDAEVSRYLTADGKPLSRADSWRNLALHIGHWHLRGFGTFAVIERATQQLVGRIGPSQPEGWPDFEIGWALRREYWGRGYAVEGTKACIAYAFRQLNLPHLISIIHPKNRAAIRVAERVGESLEREITLPFWPSQPLLQYGIHRERWTEDSGSIQGHIKPSNI